MQKRKLGKSGLGVSAIGFGHGNEPELRSARAQAGNDRRVTGGVSAASPSSTRPRSMGSHQRGAGWRSTRAFQRRVVIATEVRLHRIPLLNRAVGTSTGTHAGRSPKHRSSD